LHGITPNTLEMHPAQVVRCTRPKARSESPPATTASRRDRDRDSAAAWGAEWGAGGGGQAAAHLGLVDALDGDAVPRAAVGGGEGVAELAVAEQAADLVARLEVPLVAELHAHGRRGIRRCPGRAAPLLAVALLGRAALVDGGAGGGSGGGGEAGAHGRGPGSGDGRRRELSIWICAWGARGERYIGRLGRRVGWLARWGEARRGGREEGGEEGEGEETRRGQGRRGREEATHDDRRDDVMMKPLVKRSNCQLSNTSQWSLHTHMTHLSKYYENRIHNNLSNNIYYINITV
jgi:hypothetical protein